MNIAISLEDIPTEPRAAMPRHVTASEIARRVASGEWSARDVVDAHLRRTSEVNPSLNAVVVDLADDARRRADALDARRRAGATLGPLAGVPITVKESFHMSGTPSSAGATAHLAVVDDESPLIRRLTDADAIVVGKTNVAQCLLFHEADNPVYGRTNHPLRADRTPGGSSGGEAAILAAGGSCLGLGSDIGGSLRVPAHFSGVHTLKPTQGRLTLRGSFDVEMFPGSSVIQSTPGPLAKSVSDLALALNVLVGNDGRDSDAPPALWRDPSRVAVAGLRIAVVDDDGVFPPAPAIRRAVDEAATALDDAGADLVPARLPDAARGLSLYFEVLSADGGRWVSEYLQGGVRDRRVRALTTAAGLPNILRGPLAWALGRTGQGRLAPVLRAMGRRSAAEYWALTREVTRYREDFGRWMAAARIDAILLPPHALPALRHGDAYDVGLGGTYAALFNLLGMPAGVAAVTTVGEDEERLRRPTSDKSDAAADRVETGSAGLPVGVQVVARHWREDLVLGVMAELEAAFRDRPGYPLGAIGEFAATTAIDRPVRIAVPAGGN